MDRHFHYLAPAMAIAKNARFEELLAAADISTKDWEQLTGPGLWLSDDRPRGS